ncbi:filamentous hemagglutinin N-terminal domain-containing protein [Plectonema cf. radiosum LEGE 06105]|uniref:Filamentous hemagglutinin N-terminal domain-containing protein n=1 Tax=Plectonema cf. radiosum LEGE 06105 TaxID=945769 RepID=A0A8J7FIW5_9CYAN|nr:filamentous hemagglutinin N-terminal domain-containing protein [Plectonema radiosum]MBE9214571.1 filamentous hemagglutinin N-terminal domain-containing protein [Plectonema cf. radiosum LEGE 06105]
MSWSCFLRITCAGIGAFWVNSVNAQITPDNTLLNNSSVKVQGNTNLIEGGTTAGSNLFHSFKDFIVPTGSEAYFNNAVDISNIITRVTGDSISNIDGLIKANDKANLFLINPNGIVFGENAKLDIRGSFVGSTAESIKFADDIEFSAKNPQNTSLLTVSVPLGLQYGTNPGKIEINGKGDTEREIPELYDPKSGLQVLSDKTLALLGGDVLLNGATLKAESGRIELGSVNGEGLVSITPQEKGFAFGFDNLENFGEIELSKNTVVDATGDGAGDVQLTGKNLTLRDNSVIVSTQTGTEKSGGIVINSTDSVNLNGINDTFIPSGLYANNVSGNATENTGNIRIDTQQLTVQNGATVITNAWSAGNAGDIDIKANGLRIEGGAKISVNTHNAGNAGNLNIDAEEVEVIGTGNNGNSPSLLSVSVEKENSTGSGGDLKINTNNLLVDGGGFIFAGTSGKGNGGNMTINANNLEVEGGAKISVNTYNAGNAGNLNIDAEEVEVIGTGNNGNSPSLLSVSVEKDSTGSGGDLKINTNNLLVDGGGFIFAGTSGKGNGGNMTINAIESVKIIGQGGENNQYPSALFVVAEQPSTGDSGSLIIDTKQMLVQDGAFVSASNNSQGGAGDMKITTHDLLLKNNARFFVGRVTEDKNVGNLTIKTNNLLVESGSAMQAGTSGTSGNLNIDAQDIKVIGTGNNGNTPSSLVVSTKTNSTGDGGSLNINTKRIQIEDGAFLSTGTSGEGIGGDLNINAEEYVYVIGKGGNNPENNQPYASGLFARAEKTSTSNAGKVTIKTKQILVQDGATISTSTDSPGDGGDLNINADTILIKDGAEISAGTNSGGKGGNLTLKAKDIQLIGTGNNGNTPSSLSTSASLNSKKDAGNVNITTKQILVRDGAFVATSTRGEGNGGDLNINAQDLQIIGTGGNNPGNNNQPYVSGLFTSAEKESSGKKAGDLIINTEQMLVQDGAQVAAGTFSAGDGGELTVNAEDVKLIGTGSALFARVLENGSGKAGNLTVNTNTLLVKDNAQVSVESLGTGNAGTLTLNARFINLDNNALLNASTQSADVNKEQATINIINARNLILRRDSQILTNAKGENVQGGNINIDSDAIVALENSDISANSQNSRGGRVTIETEGIFGTQVRDALTPQSDITATGATPNLSGITEISEFDIDPTQGITELPQNPIDSEALIASSCVVRSRERNGTFFITGGEGFSYRPGDPVPSVYSTVGVQSVPNNTSVKPRRRWKIGDPIVEPSGVYRLENGRRILSRECSR